MSIVTLRGRALSLLFLVLLLGAAGANAEPGKPGNLTGIAENNSTISLAWDASISSRRIKHYRVFVNEKLVATTKQLRYTLTGLDAETQYKIEVDASDGSAYSFLASITVTTLANESEQPTEPTPTAPTDCRGKNKKLPECQNPPEEEPPEEEPPVEEPPVEEPPVVPPAPAAPPVGWQKVFEDNFDGYGDIDTSSNSKLWRFESMSDPLHRAGNNGIDEFGNLTPYNWGSPNGKRWSGWYNKYNTENAYRSDGNLIMQGLVSGEADPTRPIDYYDNGVETQYGSSKLYTAWIDTWSRKYDQTLNRQITDPDSPNKTFKYGYFETRVNFSEMKTPGFRLSMWLMPATADAEGDVLVESNAYDADGNNGVEIDIFEYEWISTEYENIIQLALHGGDAGKSATGLDTTPLGISLHQDWHTIGFLWQADKLEWSIDGQVVKSVTDAALIPDVYSYLIVSREMNSGVKQPGIDYIDTGDVVAEFPYRPRDPGLFAENIWEFKDRLATDRALVDYIRIWQP